MAKSGKPKGSKQVICNGGHVNFLLPGTKRQCNVCTRTVNMPRTRK